MDQGRGSFTEPLKTRCMPGSRQVKAHSLGSSLGLFREEGGEG